MNPAEKSPRPKAAKKAPARKKKATRAKKDEAATSAPDVAAGPPLGFVAVVGSADPNRSEYEPPLRAPASVPKACAELGAELARAGFGLIVFSPAEPFIERDVVAGYVGSRRARPGSIQIWHPRTAAAGRTRFDAESVDPELFEPLQHPSGDWDDCFYAALEEAAGVLLLGGMRSVLTAGLAALTSRTPMLVVGRFGGAAERVLARLESRPFLTESEMKVMARRTWTATSAAELVAVLARQAEARRAQGFRSEAFDPTRQVDREYRSGLAPDEVATLDRFGRWRGGFGLGPLWWLASSPLREGSSGPEVVQLQRALTGRGYALDHDGLYGPNTARQVRAYQERHEGLTPTGVADRETLEHLMEWGEVKNADLLTLLFRLVVAGKPPALIESMDPDDVISALDEIGTQGGAERIRTALDVLAARQPDVRPDPLWMAWMETGRSERRKLLALKAGLLVGRS